MSSGFLSRRGVLVLLSLVLVAILCTSAIAQTPARSPDSPGKRLEAIRAAMEKGQGLYVAGNYSGAAELFEAGYLTYPYSAFLFNAGVCYQKQNDVDRALAKFKEYLKADPSAPDVGKVNARIATLAAAKTAALAEAAASAQASDFSGRWFASGAPAERDSALGRERDEIARSDRDGAGRRSAPYLPTAGRERTAVRLRRRQSRMERGRVHASSLFGAAVAVGDLDGDGDGEVIVGAPKMTVRGQSDAGALLVFDADDASVSSFVDAKFLSSAEAGDELGGALATPHITGRDIIAAGGNGKAALFYCSPLLQQGAGGPRCP